MTLKVESGAESESKMMQVTNTDVVSSQKLTGKVSSDSQPKLRSKSGVHVSRSTGHSQSKSRLKQTDDSAVISSTTLQELNTDLATRTVAGKTVAANKKQTVHYKPAHHSAPFKTTPLPPGQSKLPPVPRPGSRKTPVTSARRSVEARRINHHGGKISVASSAVSRTKEVGRIVDDEGRRSITSLAVVAVNEASFDRNSPGNVASESNVSRGQTVELQRLGTGVSRTGLDGVVGRQSCSGIPDGGVSTDNVTRWPEVCRGHTTMGDDQTSVAASAVVDQQSVSTYGDGMTTSEVSRGADSVVQSQTEQNENVLHSRRDMEKDSSSSFTLHRDGQVASDHNIYLFIILLYTFMLVRCQG